MNMRLCGTPFLKDQLVGKLVLPVLLFAASAGSGAAKEASVTFQQISVIDVADPVALKWTAPSNLYVLSGKSETLTEFDSSGNTIRRLSGLGSDPSGLDVDTAGNVYVAVTGRNEVWKFKPTSTSFESDTSFGAGGFVGNKDGLAGTNSDQFDRPFGVTMIFNAGSQQEDVMISDSGNGRIQRFAPTGAFGGSFRWGASVESFDRGYNPANGLSHPRGLVCNRRWIYAYIVDSGNSRIVATDFIMASPHGRDGSAPGRFHDPMNIDVSVRGICVADTGNNRIQIFEPQKEENGTMHRGIIPTPFVFRTLISRELGLNQPKAVAWSGDPLHERLYIADTGNNRVILVNFPIDNPEAVWNAAHKRLLAGNWKGALRYYSSRAVASARDYYGDMDRKDIIKQEKEEPPIVPVFIGRDSAEYRYDKKNLTGSVLFVKEHGEWKLEN